MIDRSELEAHARDSRARAEFWRGRRVLVTGHTGFKGSWLALWLKRLGADVAGVALAPATAPNLFELACTAEGMRSHTGNILDRALIASLFKEWDPEVAFHLAAQAIVSESYRSPVETYATNVMGTVHVLQAARAAPSLRAVVIVTSDKCYEDRQWVWGYREEDRLGGHDPYSSSKACAELVTAAYRRSFFDPRSGDRPPVGVASARAGNAIGGGDWAQDRLVPDLVRALLAKRGIVLRRPEAVRAWQHVLAPLEGYLALAEKLWSDPERYSEAWNFGPSADDIRPVRRLAERFCEQWGAAGSWRRETSPGTHESPTLALDSAKARTELAWRPRWNLDTALERSVQWYRAFHQGEDMRAFSARQIDEYSST